MSQLGRQESLSMIQSGRSQMRVSRPVRKELNIMARN
jgi:hypothetical protein